MSYLSEYFKSQNTFCKGKIFFCTVLFLSSLPGNNGCYLSRQIRYCHFQDKECYTKGVAPSLIHQRLLLYVSYEISGFSFPNLFPSKVNIGLELLEHSQRAMKQQCRRTERVACPFYSRCKLEIDTSATKINENVASIFIKF